MPRTMKIINVNDALPEDKTYVLARYTGGNWQDSDHQEGCIWKVVKFVRGISLKERDLMGECHRKRIFCGEDEHANNKRSFCWRSFGGTRFFGQEVDYWMELPVDYLP